MEGTAAESYRCARCGAESPERSCFVFFKRYKDPSKNIQCVQCVIAQRQPKGLSGALTALFTLLSPLIYMTMGGWAEDSHTSLALKVVLACLMYPAALVIHELAHAVTGRLVGLEVGGIVFGYGRAIWRFHLGAVPIRLNMWPLSGRVYLGCDQQRFPRARVWLATLMGPLSNVLLVWAAAAGWHHLAPVIGTPVVGAWITVNLLIAFFNLLPSSGVDIGGNLYRSDGLALLQIPRVPDSQLEIYRISALLVRAVDRFEVEDFSGGLVWVEQAVRRAPGNSQVILTLGGCKIALGQYSEGLAVLAPLRDQSDLAIGMRMPLCNNVAYALAMRNAGPHPDAAELARADQLTAEIMSNFPCILTFRTTRALVLAVTRRPEEALALLEYMNYPAGTPSEISSREVTRALALSQLGRTAEAEKSAALALRVSPVVRSELQQLGIVPPSPETQLRLLGKPVPAFIAWMREIPSSFQAGARQAADAIVAPEPVPVPDTVLPRIVGVVLTMLGGGAAVLLIWMVFRLSRMHSELDRTALIVMAVIFAVAAFCLTLGYRLLLNRPSRHGSLLSARTWRVLSICCLILTLVEAVSAVLYRRPVALSFILLLPSLMFAGWCWLAARSTQRLQPELAGNPRRGDPI